MSVPLLSVCVWEGGGGECGKRGEGSNGRGEEEVGVGWEVGGGGTLGRVYARDIRILSLTQTS